MTSYLAAPWPDYTVEYRMRHKDGTWRWFMLHADLEVDDDGRPLRLLGSQIDITALTHQQAELASASARLQQLSRRLLEVQEAERRHLARELHDEIGQVLTVAKFICNLSPRDRTDRGSSHASRNRCDYSIGSLRRFVPCRSISVRRYSTIWVWSRR